MLRRLLLHARFTWRIAPGLVCLNVALTLVVAGTGTAALVTTGKFIGSLPAAIAAGSGSSQAETTWWWMAATTVAFVVGPVTAAGVAAVGAAITARFLVVYSDLVADLGTHADELAWFDDPTFAGRLDAVAQSPRDWLFVSGTNAGWGVLAERCTALGALFLLLSWNWYVPLLAVAAWLFGARLSTQWGSAIHDDMLQVTGVGRRRARYLQRLLTSSGAAKEVRLFGVADWLVDLYVRTWHEAMRVIWSRRTRGLWYIGASALTVLVGTGAAFAFLAHDAWTGAISTGSLVSLVQAVLALSAFGAPRHGDAITRTRSHLAELVAIRTQHGLADLQVDPAPAPRDPERAGAAHVEIRDVMFRYPAQDQPTIADLTLEIPAGQSIALVGANGAGKSTLIKLLCGLYRPQHGMVRIDGHDPGADPAVRARLAAVFQDFSRYHLTVPENVDPGGRHLDVDRAVARAGAQQLLADLPRGADTILSSEYAGGADLSGGQWQRVALARALARIPAGAGLLILDEPTAAQDVRNEIALFEQLLRVRGGVTTILVSHRMSSVRHADRIVVLDDMDHSGACIVEDGTHNELLAANGVYAAMFRTQAARFAEAGASR